MTGVQYTLDNFQLTWAVPLSSYSWTWGADLKAHYD